MKRRLRVSREAALRALWEERDSVIEALLCHQCGIREQALELLEAVGWSETSFMLAYVRAEGPRW